VNTPDFAAYVGGTLERVGFVMSDGSIVECKNISEAPEASFEVDAAEMMLYADDAVATWHTHPDTDNNLSVNDYEMFLSWDNLDHYVIGTNGVRKYVVRDGDVLID
jgi:proteasome lid subunit RPN8/RPN11